MIFFTMEFILYVDLIGIKWTSFNILSTTTMMESCFLTVIGKSIIKSMEIISISILELEKAATNLLGVDAQPSPTDI